MKRYEPFATFPGDRPTGLFGEEGFIEIANGDGSRTPESVLKRCDSSGTAAGGWSIGGGFGEKAILRIHGSLPPYPRHVALGVATKLLQEEREFIRGLLTAAATSGEAMKAWLRQFGDELVFSTQHRVSLAEDTVTTELVVEGRFDALLQFGVAIWINHMNGRKSISKCRLESCGKFFPVEHGKAGRPQTEYCCTEHRKKQHEKDSVTRHASMRARRAEEAAAKAKNRRVPIRRAN